MSKITQRRQLNATKSQNTTYSFIDHKAITSMLDVSGEYKMRQNQTLNVCVAPTGFTRDSAPTLISDPVKNAPKTQITLNNNTAISSAVMNKKF